MSEYLRLLQTALNTLKGILAYICYGKQKNPETNWSKICNYWQVFLKSQAEGAITACPPNTESSTPGRMHQM